MKQVGIFTVRNEVAKVMFLHESVCPQVGMPGQVHPPGPDTPAGPGAPSRTRYTSTGPGTPWDQVPPSGPGTRPRTRYPQNQVPPGAGTHPSGARYPPDQVHPLGPCAPPRRRILLRTVRILLECILVVKMFSQHYLSKRILTRISNQIEAFVNSL